MNQNTILQIIYLVLKWITVAFISILCIYAISQKQIISLFCFAAMITLLLPPLSQRLKVIIPILRYKILKGIMLMSLFIGGIMLFPTPPKNKVPVSQKESQPDITLNKDTIKAKESQRETTLNSDTIKAKQKLSEGQDDTLKMIEQEEERIMQNANQVKETKEKFEEHCMSPWDGSCITLVDYVKTRMNDPESFEHVDTRYGIQGNYATVVMSYRGKNAFGAKVLNYIKAKVSMNCEVIEIYQN